MENPEPILSIVSILAILLSPVIAVLVGQYLSEKRRRQERREALLRDLIENRYKVSSEGFLRAFNSIPIVFREQKRIRTLHKEYYDSVTRQDPESIQKGKMVAVILAICRELGYSKDIEESDIDNVFVPK